MFPLLPPTGTIAFWNMQTGERTRLIEHANLCGAHIALLQSDDGRHLVVESDKLDSPVFIYDMKTCELVHKVGRRSAQLRR